MHIFLHKDQFVYYHRLKQAVTVVLALTVLELLQETVLSTLKLCSWDLGVLGRDINKICDYLKDMGSKLYNKIDC